MSSNASSAFLMYDNVDVVTDGSDSERSASHCWDDHGDGLLSVNEFTRALPRLLREQKLMSRSARERERTERERGTADDPVQSLFARLDLSPEVWKKYAMFDPSRKYTRNLISTDDETYTLLLLCWNEGKFSPIHDHPCDGCWLRVCQGEIQETRYEVNEKSDSLDMISDESFSDSHPAFIQDSMGYHKVGNPSATVPAVTLHLYCPPFQKCKMWLGSDTKASEPSSAHISNFSEYGVKSSDQMFAVNMI